jgi:hypothetical protein
LIGWLVVSSFLANTEEYIAVRYAHNKTLLHGAIFLTSLLIPLGACSVFNELLLPVGRLVVGWRSAGYAA